MSILKISKCIHVWSEHVDARKHKCRNYKDANTSYLHDLNKKKTTTNELNETIWFFK